jgi:hypothetical protein
MATVQVKNILVGAGNLWVSKTDATVAEPVAPADIPGPPVEKPSYSTVLDGVGSDWRYVGATTGGVEVAYTPDTTDIEVDQLKDAALVFNTGQTMTVGTTMAEATLANILIAWGYRSSDLVNTGDTLNLPAAPDGLVERSIAVLGNAPTSTTDTKRERLYFGRRVVSVDGSTHTLSRTELVGIPVSFRLLPDPASVGSEYGKILDRTIT